MSDVFVDKPDSVALVEEAEKICNSPVTTTVSDPPNVDKWAFIKNIFGLPDMDLFHPVDYADVYDVGSTETSVAAVYLAELRIQYLQARLLDTPGDLHLHRLYVRNCIWSARLREPLYLDAAMSAARQMRSH